jgi:hypothetical protein
VLPTDDVKQLEEWVAADGPPPSIEMRWELVVAADRVTLYESAPPWDGRGEWSRREMAHRYARREWTLWWGDSNGRWRRYQPCPPSADIGDLIAAYRDNEYGCFD